MSSNLSVESLRFFSSWTTYNKNIKLTIETSIEGPPSKIPEREDWGYWDQPGVE